MIGVNYQARTPCPPLPVLAILDETCGVQDFAGLDVRHWRLVGQDVSRVKSLPLQADYSLWNEDDGDSPLGRDARIAAAQQAKALRPDCRLFYGAERPGIQPDMAVLEQCDGLLLHCAITQPPPTSAFFAGKPVIVGELEIDPEHADEQFAAVPAWCAQSPVDVFVFTWVWRDGDSRLNLASHSDVTTKLIALNQGGNVMPETGLVIGPGVAAWISQHQATPLDNETYHHDPSGATIYSTTPVLLGDADGKSKDFGFVYWIATTGEIKFSNPFA